MAAIAAAGPMTYIPWQDCRLPTDDFLVVRLMEIVVHADDLAFSIGWQRFSSLQRHWSLSSPCLRRWLRSATAKTRCCVR